MANLEARKPAPSQGVDVDSKAHGTPALKGDGAVTRVFHNLILPELARSAEDAAAAQRPANALGEDVSVFCDLLGAGDFSEAMDFMTGALGRGADYDSILLDLLAGAARQLGMNWEKDECGFGDVTIGMSRLHQVLQQLAINAPFQPSQLRTRGRALLAPCPGEQHNFGIMMLDHMFHRAGWDLRTIPSASGNQLARVAADSRFDLVGLSLSCDDQLPKLERVVAAIRRESRNQDVIILVGGRVFSDDPSLAAQIGADAAPASAPAALLAAEVLLERRKHTTFEQHVASG